MVFALSKIVVSNQLRQMEKEPECSDLLVLPSSTWPFETVGSFEAVSVLSRVIVCLLHITTSFSSSSENMHMKTHTYS